MCEQQIYKHDYCMCVCVCVRMRVRDLQAPALCVAFRLLWCFCVSCRQQDNMLAVDTHGPQTNKQLHSECTHLKAAWRTGLLKQQSAMVPKFRYWGAVKTHNKLTNTL